MRSLITANNLAIILIAFAAGAGLMASNFSFDLAIAQVDNVTVPAVNGTPVDVPTIAQAAETATYSVIGVILAIISLITVIVKSGLLDTILSAKQKKQVLDGSESVLVALKKALENKLLIRKSYELAFAGAPEAQKKEYALLIQNMDAQIKATTDQINFYANHFPLKVNPDANRALPREDYNIATKKLINDTFTLDQDKK